MGYAIAVHAGAVETEQRVGEKVAERFREGLRNGLLAAERALAAGGMALDAVQIAVCALEDDCIFNAGRGASFSAGGALQMDAAIMDGATAACGAVVGVKHVANPVRAARAVMETTPHVLFTGRYAERIAEAAGVPLVDLNYFRHGRREQRRLRGSPDSAGTVGAVARDKAGRMAAATSTGGVRGGMTGRVGDTPLIGAGTWADGRCAVSCTGWGEEFIRSAAAARIAVLAEHAGLSVEDAVRHVVDGLLRPGAGGVIAVGAGGVVLRTNCNTMCCAFADSAGGRGVFLWRYELPHA